MTMAQWVPIGVGVVGLMGVLATLWQRQWSEQRDRAQRAQHEARTEWWKRYQWAAEQASNPAHPDGQVVGLAIINVLGRSPLVTTSELDIIAAVADMGPGEDTGVTMSAREGQ